MSLFRARDTRRSVYAEARLAVVTVERWTESRPHAQSGL